MDDTRPDGVTAYETALEQLADCPGLEEQDRHRLASIARDMPFVADISRSDLLLYARRGDREAVLIGQARPRSTVAVHAGDLIGYRISPADQATVFRVLRWRRPAMGSRRLIDGGAPVIHPFLFMRPMRHMFLR